MHHFTRADIVGSLAAIALYPVLLFTPGYILGWCADLFSFRHRTWAFRAACSIPLSISICPVIVYLASRFGGLLAAELVMAATFLGAAILFLRRPGMGPS
jgi:hypothetical protein